MKNKGFTLIELLATISILAIVLLIAVPSVLNIIKNTEKNAFRNSILAIKKQSYNTITSNILEGNYVTPDVGYYSAFNITEAELTHGSNDYKGYFMFVNEPNTDKDFDSFVFISDGKQMVCGININDFTIDDIVDGKECPNYIGETMVINDKILTPGDIGNTYSLMNSYGTEIVNDRTIDPNIYLSVSNTELVYYPNKITVTIDYHDAKVKKYKLSNQEIKDYTGPFEISANTTIYAQGTNGDLTSEIVKMEVTNIIPENLKPILTPDDLNNIRSDLKSDYVLINDLDMSGYNFEPIESFSGKIYGNNKTISNLTINKPSKDGVALFNNPKSGVEIKNLTLENITMKGNNYVAGIVGFSDEKFLLTNVHISSGTISGINYVGGLVGDVKVSGIYLSNKAKINGNNYVGGIAGRFKASSTLTKSFNAGIIKSISHYTGGISGQQLTTTVSKVYNLGDIDAQNTIYTGGITGQLQGGNINTCYNAGKYLNNSDKKADPFVGSIYLGIVSKSSVYNISAINGIENNNYTNIETLEAASMRISYPNLDFDVDFSINESHSLPYITGLKIIDDHIIK